VESAFINILLIAVVPLAVIVAIAFATSRVRRWTAEQEKELSDAGLPDALGLGGGAVLMFVGVTLMTAEGVKLQAFIVTFLGGPLVVYLGYFYPRALRAHIDRLSREVESLRRGGDSGSPS
jgi:hypothetical protein